MRTYVLMAYYTLLGHKFQQSTVQKGRWFVVGTPALSKRYPIMGDRTHGSLFPIEMLIGEDEE